MEHILYFGQAYSNWIFLGIQMLNMVILFVLVHRITAVKKQLKKIWNQVDDYIQTVMETEKENIQAEEEARRVLQKEAQTQLISSVLEEIFP